MRIFDRMRYEDRRDIGIATGAAASILAMVGAVNLVSDKFSDADIVPYKAVVIETVEDGEVQAGVDWECNDVDIEGNARVSVFADIVTIDDETGQKRGKRVGRTTLYFEDMTCREANRQLLLDGSTGENRLVNYVMTQVGVVGALGTDLHGSKDAGEVLSTAINLVLEDGITVL